MNTNEAVAIIEGNSIELCKGLKSGAIKMQLSMPVVRQLVVRETGESSTAYNKRTAEAYGVLKPVFNKFALQNATTEIEQYGVKSMTTGYTKDGRRKGVICWEEPKIQDKAQALRALIAKKQKELEAIESKKNVIEVVA
jgi:hypothetical protein